MPRIVHGFSFLSPNFSVAYSLFSLYPLFHFCASLQKQSPEYRSVTAPLVSAIAADGKVRFV
jgi:hypothetical protein